MKDNCHVLRHFEIFGMHTQHVTNFLVAGIVNPFDPTLNVIAAAPRQVKQKCWQ